MNLRLSILALCGCVAACSSTHTPDNPQTPTSVAAQADPHALRTTLTVNGARGGSFVCHGGLVFATATHNASSQPVRLRRLTVRFDPVASPSRCQSHAAEIDGQLGTSLPAGADLQVRSFDSAGTLCYSAHGSPGCSWTATATLWFDGGLSEDFVGFATYETHHVPPDPGCDRLPRVATPREGDVLSGVVEVMASVVESRYCVNSARTVVKAFAAGDHRVVYASSELDLGDRAHWDTRTVPNGRYGLTAEQNCCHIPSEPIYVTVNN